MEAAVYHTSAWRDLPRNYCAVELLFGEAAGECCGLIGHHHVDETDPHSRTVQVCAGHHSKVQAVLRRLRRGDDGYRRCTHSHPYPGGREACERRLNPVG